MYAIRFLFLLGTVFYVFNACGNKRFKVVLNSNKRKSKLKLSRLTDSCLLTAGGVDAGFMGYLL